VYSRVTLLEVDTVRIDVEEALEAYRTDVLAQLRRRPGYEGAFVLLNPEGQGLILTLWSSEDEMAATGDLVSDAFERFATVFRAPPGRESYEVRLADVPALAEG
jgi:heme-degrading monooxygenase HmoA